MDIINVDLQSGKVSGIGWDKWDQIQRDKHAKYKKPEVQQIVSRKVEKEEFVRVLDGCGGNREMTAAELGISKDMVVYYFNRYLPERVKKRNVDHGVKRLIPEEFYDNGCCEDDDPKPPELARDINVPTTDIPTLTDLLPHEAKMALEPPGDFGTDTNVGTTAEEREELLSLTKQEETRARYFNHVNNPDILKGMDIVVSEAEPDMGCPEDYADPEWREVSVNVALDHRADLEHDIEGIEKLLMAAEYDQFMTSRIGEALKQIKADFEEQVDNITNTFDRTKVMVWGMD